MAAISCQVESHLCHLSHAVVAPWPHLNIRVWVCPDGSPLVNPCVNYFVNPFENPFVNPFVRPFVNNLEGPFVNPCVNVLRMLCGPSPCLPPPHNLLITRRVVL